MVREMAERTLARAREFAPVTKEDRRRRELEDHACAFGLAIAMLEILDGNSLPPNVKPAKPSKPRRGAGVRRG